MKLSPNARTVSAARVAFDFLSATDPLAEVISDAVIGFGTFDVTLASYCGQLFEQLRMRRIVFTGGIGAGTVDLGMPEADAWRQQLARTHPSIPPSRVIVENQSTNTAENIRFTAARLLQLEPDFAFGRGLQRALIVASPSRLRRVGLTLAKLVPELRITRCRPPSTTFEREFELHESKGIDYPAHLAGEVHRLITYPAKGWIVYEPVPSDVVEAYETLDGR